MTKSTTPAQLAAAVPAELVPADASIEALLVQLWRDTELTGELANVVTSYLRSNLAELCDPHQALLQLLRFLECHHEPEPRAWLISPRVLPQVMSLFAFSPRLGNVLIKYPDLLPELFPVASESAAALGQRLTEWLAARLGDDALAVLRQAKLREFIRIAVADVRGLDELEVTTAKISAVADCTVGYALRACGLEGEPFAVIAMGKWGGRELNYSSDIDILYVAGDQLDRDQLAALQKRGAALGMLMAQATEDGFVFRVDNRLRPEGSSGILVRSLKQYMDHYDNRAQRWEFQALVKARAAAGDETLGQAFCKRTRQLVYNDQAKPEEMLVEVREMKDKIERGLRAKHTAHGNVKLGVGGIRDIEFIIQFLQLHHGVTSTDFRVGDSLTAMRRFRAHRIITESEFTTLNHSYRFLRRLEHCLQITNELACRQLPSPGQQRNVLARKMSLISDNEIPSGALLQERYDAVIAATRDIFHHFFDATISFLAHKQRVRDLLPDLDPQLIDEHFSRLESDYFLRFEPAEIAGHLRMITKLSESRLCEIDIRYRPQNVRRVTIVAYDFFTEFAKISGLFAAYGQNILDGESYTYAELKTVAERPSRPAFYRRPRRRYAVAHSGQTQQADRRKIICVIDCRADDRHRTFMFSWEAFNHDLHELLELLRDGKFEEASERITLRVMKTLTAAEAPVPDALLPIEIEIDNESDRTYTILDIRSQDSFMFLFEFTNALATRNYYIGKAEISTIDDEVHDRLFITTRNGAKIEDAQHLHELRVTIVMMKQFARFLPQAPNPQLALKQFSGLVASVIESRQRHLIPFMEQSDLADLARILGAGTYLWEDFLRLQHEHLLPIITEASRLDDAFDAAAGSAALQQSLAAATDYDERVRLLNEFKDREIVRIDLRHLSGRIPRFTHFCRELSDLADVVLTAAFDLGHEFAAGKLGEAAPGQSCLCALGKWGGREIGYASDIELIFVWDGEAGDTTYYNTAAQGLANALRSKRDGIFELDWRLRPGGRNDSLATPVARFEQFFAESGSADPFQRQALIRLRAVTGDEQLARRVEAHRAAYVFAPTPFAITRVFELRQRQLTEQVKTGELNAKIGQGGLVEAEYFIQVLQIHYGGRFPECRDTNTRAAAKALCRANVLSAEEYQAWVTGYRLLRAIINALRIVRGNARDLVIPAPATREFEFLTRRLRNFDHLPDASNTWAFIRLQMTVIHGFFVSLPERCADVSHS